MRPNQTPLAGAVPRTTNESPADPTSVGHRKAGSRSPPAYLSADQDELIRPETMQRLMEILGTSAVRDCPVNISRDEARTIVEMMETRWVVARAWSRTLEWGIRYAGIARRMAERSGFADYVGWMDRRRIEPMRQLHAELTSRSAIAPDQLADTA